MQDSDEARGDQPRTIEQVYDSVAPLLLNIAIQKFHVPPEDAGPLVHDVFLTFLAQQHVVRAVDAYLIGGICNASRGYWSRRKTEEKFVEPLRDDGSYCVAPLDDVAVRAQLTRMLAGLSPKCRETLRRFYINGESAADLASGFATTRTYIFRLLQLCRSNAKRIFEQLGHRRSI